MILFLFLFVSFATIAETCDSSCYFLYDNRTGEFNPNLPSSKDLVSPSSGGELTGVVTVKGALNDDNCSRKWGGNHVDYLRFRRLEGGVLQYQTLAIELFSGAGLIHMYLEGVQKELRTRKSSVKNWRTGGSKGLVIQISTAWVFDGFYDMYINKKHLQFNYGSSDTWSSYKDNRLNTVNNVYSDLFCTHYDYIMVCKDAQPKVCELTLPKEYLSLGTAYQLTCIAVGSPILDVTWQHNGVLISTDHITQELTQDDVITSTLTLTEFSTADYGRYTCTVRNRNYGYTASKMKDLVYKELAITTQTQIQYNTGSVKIVWTVTGWPLARVIVTCGAGEVSFEEAGYHTMQPSRVFSYENTTPDISCEITNGGVVTDTTVLSMASNEESVKFILVATIAGLSAFFNLTLGLIYVTRKRCGTIIPLLPTIPAAYVPKDDHSVYTDDHSDDEFSESEADAEPTYSNTLERYATLVLPVSDKDAYNDEDGYLTMKEVKEEI